MSRSIKTLYNPERKNAFLDAYPYWKERISFLNTQTGVGAYEIKIQKDLADMTYAEVESACQTADIFSATQATRLKAIVKSYLEWCKETGIADTTAVLKEMRDLEIDFTANLKRYYPLDITPMLRTVEEKYPTEEAYVHAVTLILCFAGLDYSDICSLSSDDVSEVEDCIKIEFKGRTFWVDDPLQVQLINAYRANYDKKQVVRHTHSAYVHDFGLFLKPVPYRKTDIPKPLTHLDLRVRAYEIFRLVPEHRGGITGIQHAGIYCRAYRHECAGDFEAKRYFAALVDSPSPVTRGRIEDFIETYQAFKEVYGLKVPILTA